jgi:hypothetical protein
VVARKGIEVMNDDIQQRKQGTNLKWIKGDSGNTYLCPVDALEKLENPTEEDLKKICVDESSNPQND